MLASFTVSYGQVNAYSFAESTETYTPVVGTASTVLGDDGIQDMVPIGFTFTFDGIAYTDFGISTNGWIKMGTVAIGGGSWTNALGNAAVHRPLIAPFWDDHNMSTGNIQYSLSGSAPNQVLEVGWDNVSISNGGTASTTVFGSFKLRLYETTNVIEFVYGPSIVSAGAITASIGINGASTFLSVTPGATSTVSSATANNAIAASTNVVGKKYTFTPPNPCTGTPTPGATISSNSEACSGVNFTLSLENQTSGSGVTYVWQTSPDGSSWSDTAGTSNAFTTSQTALTYYQCVVSCTATSSTTVSTPIMIGMSNLCYCTPTYTTGKTDGDLISNIVIAGTTLANNSGTAPVNPSYTFFSGQPNYTATLQAGSSYNITVSIGTFGGQNVAVWIDYDDDGVFATTERVGFTGASIAANGTATFSIALACNPALGLHRMRVRDVWNTTGNAIDPCINYGWGETEDYDITISTALPCPQPSALAVDAITSDSANLLWNIGCAETAWDLHLTTAGGGAPSGAPSNPGVSSPFAATSLSPSTAYEFYVRADCAGDGTSLWTGPFPFTTNALPPLNDECTGAYPVTVNPDFSCASVTSGTVNAATASSTDNSVCFGEADDDVWFSFVATATTHQISLNNVNGSTTDLYHSLWSGTDCSSLNLVADSCSDANLSTPTGLNIGDTYYIRVYTYTNIVGQDTTFDVCVGTFPPTPANDDCSGAIPVTVNPDLNCGSVTAGSIASATASSVNDTVCGGTEDDDVWFSFVATDVTQTISLNNVAGSTTDLYHSLWTGADCSSLSLVANSCSDANSSTPTGLTPGETYYIRVYTWTDLPNQTSTFDVCVGTLPPPPVNDDCSGAIALTNGGVFADNPIVGTNASATDSGGPAPGCAQYLGGDVWYTVTVPDSGNLTIETGTGTITDTGMAVYSGDCNGLTLVDCDDDSSLNGNYSLISLTGRTPGEVLYVSVWEYFNDFLGAFQISAYDGSLANHSFDNANFVYYPNPVKNMLNLSYTQNISDVQIFNLLGQQVMTKAINANQSQIDMSSLATGAYLVKVTADNQVKTIKVFKE